MATGPAVIRYQGTRAVTWRLRYRDAAGRTVYETLGREPAWNRRRAERELGKRLAAVEDGWRKPTRTTFASFSLRFFDEYLPGRNLKPTTLENYRYMLERHLLPHFGHHKLIEIEAHPDLIDAYISLKAKQGLSAKTIHNHLLLLNLMLRRAAVWRLIRSNPMAGIDRPRVEQPEMNILTDVEINRLLKAYEQLHHDAPAEERAWWLLAKTIVETALGTGMRRGELLGLRWDAVDLLEGKIEVRETIVRGTPSTPKSKASRRVLELGPRTRTALERHWKHSHYRDDRDLVFCHPVRGTALDPSALAGRFLKPALAKAGIKKPVRPFHDLRHTSLTYTAAADNPQIYVQARAGHSQGAITERYMHAAQVQFPGAAERSEQRIFGNRRKRKRAA
ncbi:MAG: tyrosine-type recombinase/integrase [Acetobacteraceae bacterium]